MSVHHNHTDDDAYIPGDDEPNRRIDPVEARKDVILARRPRRSWASTDLHRQALLEVYGPGIFRQHVVGGDAA